VEQVVRIICSRFLMVVALGLLPIGLVGLSGCDSKPADGMLEEPHIDADQKAEVKAEYQKRRLEQRQSKSSKKGKTAH
jgi:hypothetical protein